jgi:dihydropteroate synthase
MRVTPLLLNRERDARDLFAALNVSPQGIDILAPKSIFAAFKIDGLSAWAANIIKQELLSLGADAALDRAVLIKEIKTSIVIFGSVSQLNKLSLKLKNQPFGLKELADKLVIALDNYFNPAGQLLARGKRLGLAMPVVCGILNITPDSFSGDGILKVSSAQTIQMALTKAEEMLASGAKILDVGAQSSRPGAKPVSPREEAARILPAIKGLRKEFKNVLISVDTYRYETAQKAAECGVDIINDITALRHAPKIAQVIKKYKLGCVLMHMQGTPQTMQKKPVYSDVVGEVNTFFKERLAFCEKSGLSRRSLMLDPGIGFGKTLEHNLALLKNIAGFKVFGCPIMVGLSRKSFVGKALDLPVNERLYGTLGASVYAVNYGAQIFRTHDVKATVEALSMAARIKNYD